MQIALSTEHVVKLLLLCQPDRYEIISQCSFNLHFCCDEQSRISFYQFKRYLHFFSVNCLFIPLDHVFYMVVGSFFYILLLEAHYLFVCVINYRYFSLMSHLLCLFFFFF